MEGNKDIYKTSRLLYIIEAALEYFISILVTGAYLAKITAAIGMSDAVTGILTALFQMSAMCLSSLLKCRREQR